MCSDVPRSAFQMKSNHGLKPSHNSIPFVLLCSVLEQMLTMPIHTVLSLRFTNFLFSVCIVLLRFLFLFLNVLFLWKFLILAHYWSIGDCLGTTKDTREMRREAHTALAQNTVAIVQSDSRQKAIENKRLSQKENKRCGLYNNLSKCRPHDSIRGIVCNWSVRSFNKMKITVSECVCTSRSSVCMRIETKTSCSLPTRSHDPKCVLHCVNALFAYILHTYTQIHSFMYVCVCVCSTKHSV